MLERVQLHDLQLKQPHPQVLSFKYYKADHGSSLILKALSRSAGSGLESEQSGVGG